MLDLLQKFMLLPAPSGYEGPMAYALREALLPLCDSVELDRMGNCIGRIRGTQGEVLPRAMVFAHLDSLGFIVRHVGEDGFVGVDRLGGVPEKALPGLRLSVRSEDGLWHDAAFGPKAHHAMSAEDKLKVDPVTSLTVDLGLGSAEQAHEKGIYPGCPAVYAPSFTRMGDKVCGTFVDDRGGCAALVRIAELLRERRPACDVFLVGTVWEEFNLRGAMLAARTVHPDIGISLDVTLAADTPDLRGRYDVFVGQGPCAQLYSFHGRGTLNGTLPHEPLFRLCRATAAEEGLPLQRFAALGLLTDSAYLQLEGMGVAMLEMGFPARYTHTPVEICDPRDIGRLALLAAATLRRVDGFFPLSRY